MGYEFEVQKIKKFWFCNFENKILMNSDQMQQLFSEQVFLKSYSFSRSFGYIQYAVFIHCIKSFKNKVKDSWNDIECKCGKGDHPWDIIAWKWHHEDRDKWMLWSKIHV